jgi:carboxypeptidase C (cathepsin A)
MHVDTFELIENKDSWTKEYDMLFIDNPVGAGE